MTTGQHVAVVGASLAGLRAAEQLRASGHGGPITVLGAETHLPYNRPPLSKEVLAGPEPSTVRALAEQLRFRRRSSIADVEFRLGDPVVQVDMRSRRLVTGDGTTLDFDGLVVATGLRSRRLAVPGPKVGRHVLRTVEDCHGLREALRRAGRVRAVVVGAGFIGCEVAATLRTLGHDVTVVEPAGPPLARVIGRRPALAVQRHHEAAGVRFVIGDGVAGFVGAERVAGVALASGGELPADLVIEAVGSICNVEWLEGNDLDLSDGVLTDNRLAVVGASTVVAVGDLARFPNPLIDEVPRRVEHWSMPTDTAKRAAATLVTELRGGSHDDAPFTPVPWFWSDQLDLRIQSFGSPALADECRIEEGDVDDPVGGLLATYFRAGRHVGTLAVNLSAVRQRDLRSQFANLVPVA